MVFISSKEQMLPRCKGCLPKKINYRKAVLNHSVLEAPLGILHCCAFVNNETIQVPHSYCAIFNFPFLIVICYFPPPGPSASFFIETPL